LTTQAQALVDEPCGYLDIPEFSSVDACLDLLAKSATTETVCPVRFSYGEGTLTLPSIGGKHTVVAVEVPIVPGEQRRGAFLDETRSASKHHEVNDCERKSKLHQENKPQEISRGPLWLHLHRQSLCLQIDRYSTL
jgi:hypothetical protein